MLLVGLLTDVSGLPLVLGSFGATCVLVFGYPESPFSQPRSVIGGHVLASAIGLMVLHLVCDGPWCLGLATGLAIAAMMALRVVHPPAGSNPVIVFQLAVTQPLTAVHPVLNAPVIAVHAAVIGATADWTASPSFPVIVFHLLVTHPPIWPQAVSNAI